MATKSWLTKNNVLYTEKNVSQDGVADELFALGYRTTRVFVDDRVGGQVIVGYNTKRLAEALL